MESFIVTNPAILGGKPVIRGTRISVEFVLELLASGATIDSILASYPDLTREQIAAALKYAARTVASSTVFELETSP
jgi:uncharacterized protein (DUF433 family)